MLAERYNQDKLQWHHVPLFLLEPLMRVGHYGGQKYDDFNYFKGAPQSQYLDSLKRHLCSYESPFESDVDPESQINHLAHVAWNALVAIHMLKHRPDLDDRYKIQ